MTAQLKIDGRWASTIAAWGDLAWKTALPGGMSEVTWSMDVDTTFRHQSLKVDALVEVYDGALRIGAGVMSEPNLAGGTFTAAGLYSSGANFLALDASGNGTSVPNVAIDRAILRGLRWSRSANFSSVAFAGDGAETAANKVTTLLEAFSDQTGTWPMLDGDGFVTNMTRPTTPTWHLLSGVADLGIGEGEYASDLFGRRLGSGGTFAVRTRGDAAARAAFGRREAPVDLTTQGVMSDAKADAILDGLLAKGRARPAFTNSVEVTPEMLLTSAGVPADLSMVTAGQMVRAHGFYDDVQFLNGATYIDWIIGETSYADGSGVLTLSPLGLEPRDLAGVLADIPAPTKYVA